MGSDLSRSLPSTGVSAPRASVHVLGLQDASVAIIDDQETARIALDEMIRGIYSQVVRKRSPGSNTTSPTW
jgi:hypothetical protein